jgi:lycopene cyclase domain-containing protein
MTFLYLAALVVSIIGMIVLDRRFRLFFWVSPARATVVLAAGVLVFLVWDLFGIGAGVFFRGEHPGVLTGVLLAPELPLEEVFFLVLLCYTTMNAYSGFLRWSERRRAVAPEADR